MPGTNVKWPEQNPIKHKILEKRTFFRNSWVNIFNYRYPAVGVKKPIGIIYLIHGYTDHIGNKAHIAKKFAEAGYDVIGIDMKGFGKSEGRRCFVRRYQDLVEQHLSF